MSDYDEALKAVREAIVFNIYSPNKLAEEILSLPMIGVVSSEQPTYEYFDGEISHAQISTRQFQKKGWRKLVEKGKS